MRFTFLRGIYKVLIYWFTYLITKDYLVINNFLLGSSYLLKKERLLLLVGSFTLPFRGMKLIRLSGYNSLKLDTQLNLLSGGTYFPQMIPLYIMVGSLKAQEG